MAVTKQLEQTVWEYYRAHGRHDLPWRTPEPNGLFDPYKIVVSEVMLQQTQVSRVIPAYERFLAQFPSCTALAKAPLAAVLRAWSGLGYNRRAKFLWQAAQVVVAQYGGEVPRSVAELAKLPGIGPNTAGAIVAYAHNSPAVFVETNIRTVFIHHFFTEGEQVADREILDLVARTLPDNPREWYWALMDYGAHLKRSVGNLSQASKHYTKQPRFTGSRRQARGQVLKLLGQRPATLITLQAEVASHQLPGVLADLEREGLIRRYGDRYSL